MHAHYARWLTISVLRNHASAACEVAAHRQALVKRVTDATASPKTAHMQVAADTEVEVEVATPGADEKQAESAGRTIAQTTIALLCHQQDVGKKILRSLTHHLWVITAAQMLWMHLLTCGEEVDRCFHE